MANEKTELERGDVLRLSNKESNRITRECIQAALIQLLADRELDQISVCELVQRAGVSRTAFYRNYVTKEDVLVEYYHRLLTSLDEVAYKSIKTTDPMELCTLIFRTIKQNSSQVAIFLKANLQIKEFEATRNFLIQKYPNLEQTTRRMLLAWWGLLRNLILDWYLSGMKTDIFEMAELCYNLSEGLLRKIQQSKPNFSPV